MAGFGSRSRHREINAWPGWVDALSSLVMVVIFLLMIFVVGQVFTAATLTRRDEQLQSLNAKVAQLNRMLALERDANVELRLNVSQLSDQLQASAAVREEMSADLTRLQDAREDAERRIAGMERIASADRATIEAQLREMASLQSDLAALRALREKLEGDVAVLARLSEGLKAKLNQGETELAETAAKLTDTASRLTDTEARLSEIRSRLTDSEAARDDLSGKLSVAESATIESAAKLTASEKERAALDATLAELRARAAKLEEDDAAGRARLRELDERLNLTDAERLKLLADLKAAGEKLAALERAHADTTAKLTLSEEEKAKLLEEMGALRDRSKKLDADLADAREKTMLAQKDVTERQTRLDELTAQLGTARDRGDQGEAQVALLNQQMAALRAQLARIAATLEASEKRNEEQRVQIVDLGSRLNQALATRVQELARYRSEFFGRVREALGNRPDVRIVGDRFVFQSELLFPSASATLQPAGRERMGALAQTLIAIGNRIPADLNWVLRVDGHTDARAINNATYPSNWELSTARAISVVKFLIEQGIPPERLAATGFGEFQPLDPGTSEEAMARNRRIELKLDQR